MLWSNLLVDATLSPRFGPMTLSEPLRFRPRAFAKVWGGVRLQALLGEDLGLEGPVGEVWQLVDRDGCSSRVDGGSLGGRSLGGLMLSERESLLGAARASADGHFPLIVKLIDCSQPLSIQVHPDAQAARRLGGESKNECWYVLAAEEDSEIYLGLKQGVDSATFAAAAGDSAIVELLQSFPVKPGYFVAVPAGTVHAIGSGVTVVEVQENAETTYRLFDWERRGLDGVPRPLHREEALQSIDYERQVEGPWVPDIRATNGVNCRAVLLDAETFGVELLQINQPLEHDTADRAWIYVVVSGSGRLAVPATGGSWRLGRGETWLAPASLGVHRFEAVDGELEVLRIEARV